MRWIYISPHFDDAILSCGGLIREQTKNGYTVEIWTICGGDAPSGPLSPFAMACHQQWGIDSADQVIAARRIENQEAAARVGADTVDFSIPDCIYRRSPTGELLYPDGIFVPIHPREKGMDAVTAIALASELLPEDVVVSPLAVGGHVDHVFTRRIAERLDRPLRYYADIPYFLDHPEMLAAASYGLVPEHQPVSEHGLQAWQEGIAAYSSQIPMLFKTLEKMQLATRQYWAAEDRDGIRLWYKP